MSTPDIYNFSYCVVSRVHIVFCRKPALLKRLVRIGFHRKLKVIKFIIRIGCPVETEILGRVQSPQVPVYQALAEPSVHTYVAVSPA